MNIYADTGMLISLYSQDANSGQARSIAVRHHPTFLLTGFGEAQFANACQLRVFRKPWTRAQAQVVREKFVLHLRSGVFKLEEVPHQVWALAVSLSDLHTATLGTRGLDVLHVASALILKPAAFGSFDERQRSLARAMGLRLLPS